MKMLDVRLYLFVCVNLFLYVNCSIPKEKLCANPTCTEPISTATGNVHYNAVDKYGLSFKPGEHITVLSKSKTKSEYWEVLINGKKGYVPSHLIQERKVFYSNDKLQFVPADNVPTNTDFEEKSNLSQHGNDLLQNNETLENLTEAVSSNNNILSNDTPENEKSSKETLTGDFNNSLPTKTFEVIEGTTVYVDGPAEVKPSATVHVEPNSQTAAPVPMSINKTPNKKENGGREEPKRATIPVDVLNINANYKGKMQMDNPNLKIDSVEENDDNIEVEEEDENDEDEEDENNIGDEDENNIGDEEENQDEFKIKETNNNSQFQEINKEAAHSNENPEIAQKTIESENSKVKESFLGVEQIEIKNENNDSQSANPEGNAEVAPESKQETVKNENLGGWNLLNSNFKEKDPPASLNLPSEETNNLFDANVNKQYSVSQPALAPPGNIIEQNTVSSESVAQIPNFNRQDTMGNQLPAKTEIDVTSEIPNTGKPEASQVTGKPSVTFDSVAQVSIVENQGKITGIPFTADSALPVTENPNFQRQEVSLMENQYMMSEENVPQNPVNENLHLKKPDAGADAPQLLNTDLVSDGSFRQNAGTENLKVEKEELLMMRNQFAANNIPPTTENSNFQKEKVPLMVKQNTLSSGGVPQNQVTKNPDLEKPVADAPQVLNPYLTSADFVAQNPGVEKEEPPIMLKQYTVSAEGITQNPIIDNVEMQQKETSTMKMKQEKFDVLTEASSQIEQNIISETVNESTQEEEKSWDLLQEDKTRISEDVQLDQDANPHKSEEPAEQTEITSEGFFAQISQMFSGWFVSSSINEEVVDKVLIEKQVSPERNIFENNEEQKKTSVNEEFNNAPESCQDSGCTEYFIEGQPSLWTALVPSSLGFDNLPTSGNTFLYLVVTAITVLLFTLGHNFIEKRGKTAPLIAKINKLEQELLVSSKECLLLKEDIQSAKDKITLYENSANDELVLSLQAELEESKKAKSDLETNIEVLQQELDAATEAGLDLNKMLSEVLTQKGGSESLLESVESLQAQLDSQQKIIDEMTKKLGVKNEENEALQTALEAANEKAENLEEQLTDIKHNLNIHLKEKEELTQDLKSQINQLQIRINQLTESKEKEVLRVKKNLEDLEKKFKDTSEALTIKEEEFKALKDSIRQIKTKGNAKLEALFDVCQVKATLAKTEKESHVLQEKLKEEETSKKVLEDQVKYLDEEVNNLKRRFEEAEKEKDEAQKKLEVLSTYFKEKETQLQKELGLQEAMWAQKKGDEKAVYNMMKSLQEEVDSYKSQNETLKKEILDQERGLKNQIATLEQKAHENWVAARQAERKLEENKQETAQLRNRLTLSEKNVGNDVEAKANHRTSEELNGVEPTSPILHDTSSPLLFPPLPMDPNSSLLPPGFMPHPMFMPPPMGGFIPPPPFLPGDRRPPPLGRMSSPPLNNQFSPPPPPDYSFERMSSPPLSPPARNYRSPNEADRDRERFRHRTPPYPPLHSRNWDDSNEMPGFIPISSQRDSRREHKGSNVSSGHSSSDSLDKSSRHSGRV